MRIENGSLENGAYKVFCMLLPVDDKIYDRLHKMFRALPDIAEGYFADVCMECNTLGNNLIVPLDDGRVFVGLYSIKNGNFVEYAVTECMNKLRYSLYTLNENEEVAFPIGFYMDEFLESAVTEFDEMVRQNVVMVLED